MTDLAKRLTPVLRPDSTRTVIRPFILADPEAFAQEGHPRTQRIVDRILALDAAEVADRLRIVSKSLDDRHRDPERSLLAIFRELEGLQVDRSTLSHDQALLIGTFFSE